MCFLPGPGENSCSFVCLGRKPSTHTHVDFHSEPGFYDENSDEDDRTL